MTDKRQLFRLNVRFDKVTSCYKSDTVTLKDQSSTALFLAQFHFWSDFSVLTLTSSPNFSQVNKEFFWQPGLTVP